MTPAEVRELFDYDASTGELRWRGGRRAGGIAGMVNKAGYRVVWGRGGKESRKMFLAHRLIWLWVYGEWPTKIDHISGDKADNRLANLRQATNSGNSANSRLQARSKSGFKGVWRHGPGWAASIRKDNVTRHLGTFPTPELAYAAYCRAADSLHGEFARFV
jgi:hypothetical protein